MGESKRQTKSTNFMLSSEVLLKVVEPMQTSWVLYETAPRNLNREQQVNDNETVKN